MKVCVDVGNTTVGIGIFKENKIIYRYSFLHRPDVNISDFVASIRSTLSSQFKLEGNAEAVMYSSVVPNIDNELIYALSEIYHAPIMRMNKANIKDVKITKENQKEIGEDLVADLVAGANKYRLPLLIIDVGTATKILHINKKKEFYFCSIVPGLSISASTLFNKAALLSDITFDVPTTVLATNTKDALNSGIVFGHAEMIEGLCKRYESETHEKCTRVLTGGHAKLLSSVLSKEYIVDENLALEGLNMLLEEIDNKSFYDSLTRPYQLDLLKNLAGMVAIDSTLDLSTACDDHPFGKGVSAALSYIYELAKKDGFHVKNYENKIVEITVGEGKNITVLSHADVVPAGDTGWEQNPFSMVDHGTYLTGRGVSDDKGPMLASYYALKALRDANMLGDYQVRFLVGGNEETGSKGVEYYFHELKKPAPDLGFSPDADFPLIFAEKGIIGFEVKFRTAIPHVYSIKAGVASNAVIDRCTLVTDNNPEFIQYLQDKKVECEVSVKGDKLEVAFLGISAHGSTPWLGVNAGLICAKVLRDFYKLPVFAKIISCYGDLHGEGVHANGHSKEMHDNSLNMGIMNFDGKELTLILNYRYVDTCKKEDMIQNFITYSKPFEVTVLSEAPLLYYPKNSTLVDTLLKAYQAETGDYESEPLAIGGGTYAKETENVVAFGMEFPGHDSHMHSPGERVEKEHLFKAMSIYARAIIELGKKL